MNFSTAATVPSLQPRVLADLIPGERVRDALLIVGAAGFVGLLAQIAIPVPGTPVPISGQTFGVLLAGAALGWKRGLASMLLYVLVGAAGVPWFSEGGSGMEVLTGPNFGYIIGFVLAATVVGALAGMGNDRTVWGTVAVMVIGNVIIYLCGVPWLMQSLNLTFAEAYAAGVAPFLLGAGVKTFLAAGILPSTWKLANHTPNKGY